MPESTAAGIVAELEALAAPQYAETLQWFFKTGPGEYGEGDRFRGIKVPAMRRVCRAHRGIAIDELAALLASEWHEDRLAAALLMAADYPRADDARKTALHDLLLARTDRFNNWDLVDQSAPYVVGPHLDVVGAGILDELAGSVLLWERRIAMVATHFRIRRGETEDALRIAERLLGDDHPLIHKAVGWMLREVGKRADALALIDFLEDHAAAMSATTLAYACERLEPEQRERYRAMRRAGA